MSARAPCAGWSRAAEGFLKRRTQVKNEVSAVLQRNLERPPAGERPLQP